MARVLLVDDDFDITDALRGILEDRYEVDVAANGAEALEKLANGSYDAIVLDLMMPVMDGETFLKTVRAQGSKIPVIIASASANISKVSGANDFVHKPFNVGELEKKLDALISGNGSGGQPGGPSGSTSGGTIKPGPLFSNVDYGNTHALARSDLRCAVVSVESFSQ